MSNIVALERALVNAMHNASKPVTAAQKAAAAALVDALIVRGGTRHDGVGRLFWIESTPARIEWCGTMWLIEQVVEPIRLTLSLDAKREIVGGVLVWGDLDWPDGASGHEITQLRNHIELNPDHDFRWHHHWVRDDGQWRVVSDASPTG